MLTEITKCTYLLHVFIRTVHMYRGRWRTWQSFLEAFNGQRSSQVDELLYDRRSRILEYLGPEK